MFAVTHFREILAVVVSGCLATAGVMIASPVSAGSVGVITEYSSGLTPGTLGGITAGPDGNLWFTETSGNRIGRINPTTGAITEYSSGLTAGGRPEEIAAGPDGNLWFTEYLGNRIGRINPVTGAITEYSSGITAGARPIGIVAGPDGNLWFTEYLGNRIGRINPTTGTISEYSTGLTADALPKWITTGPDGNLWFTEVSGGRIGRINPTTHTIVEHSTGSADSSAIAAGPDGYLWLAEFNLSRIGRINPATAAITEYSSGLTASTGPVEITAGPDGNLWFTEFADRIGRITSGKDAPLIQPPAVTGSLRSGEQQQCTGEQWDTWNGSPPTTAAVTWSLDGQPIPGTTGRTHTPTGSDVGKALTCTVQARYSLPLVSVQATSSTATVLPAATQAASLTVKARKAGNAVPRTGKTTLVKKVAVGPGQTARITVTVTPRKTRHKVKVTRTSTTVKVRTKKAPKARVAVKIISSGAGFTPTTWIRTWKVR